MTDAETPLFSAISFLQKLTPETLPPLGWWLVAGGGWLVAGGWLAGGWWLGWAGWWLVAGKSVSTSNKQLQNSVFYTVS